MNAELMLVDNAVELDKYNAIVEKYGFEEAFNLGYVTEPVKERWIKSDVLLDINEIKMAWRLIKDNAINIKLIDGDIWSLSYTDELWDKLEKHFKKREEL